LELRFSSKLFVADADGKNNKAADRSRAIRDLMKKHVFLQDISTPNNQVHPSDARAPDNNPRPDDYTRWLFVFAASSFEYSKNYQLKLTPQRLFDVNGLEVELRTVHNYTMTEFEARCNGHGTFNEQTKKMYVQYI